MDIPDDVRHEADFYCLGDTASSAEIEQGYRAIAEWARNEALQEAENMFRAEEDHFHTHEAAYAVHLLAEGRDWFRWREEPSRAAWDACDAYIEEIL